MNGTSLTLLRLWGIVDHKGFVSLEPATSRNEIWRWMSWPLIQIFFDCISCIIWFCFIDFQNTKHRPLLAESPAFSIYSQDKTTKVNEAKGPQCACVCARARGGWVFVHWANVTNRDLPDNSIHVGLARLNLTLSLNNSANKRSIQHRVIYVGIRVLWTT